MHLRRIPWLILLLALAGSARSQLLINEIMASNASFSYEEDYYNFSDWLEILNTGTSALNLGIFYLSDDLEDLQKWRLPDYSLSSGAYYIVYCDKEASGNHTNFGLRTEGETVYLSDASGNIIDYLAFGQQYPDISCGRDPSAREKLRYCATPTPGTANSVSTAKEPGPRASYSIPPGRLDAPASLSLNGDAIHFTANNLQPSLSSSSYTEPLSISRTLTVKTKTYQEGYLPGMTYGQTYFLNEHSFTLPVVCLSFEPEHFFDDMIGIHVRGSNGTAGYCGDVANWYQDWERPAWFEYFDEQGVRRIAQTIGVKMAGGCTRGRDQKAMSFYARGKYGNNNFDYAFFREKPDINSFPSVLLRNSGNDQDQTLLRDAFLQALVKQSMDIDYQAYQPAIVYFNGFYRGIYNLREKTNEDYVVTNYFLDEDDFDMLERDREIIQGSDEDYTVLVNYLKQNNLFDDAKYQVVASQIDVQEFINWLTINLYIGNRDWPGNNHKFWKSKENGKWRWLMFDLDYGFGFRMDSKGYTHETFAHATDGSDSWSTLLFRKLLQNEGFKKQFLSTYLTHVYSSFEPDWCNYVLDSLSAVIDYEIFYNQQRWGRTKDQWEDYLTTLKKYAVDRHGFMPDYVKSYFNLNSDPVTLTVNNPDIRKGKVKVNEAIVQRYPLELDTYRELPLSIVAVPAKGYRFSRWINSADASMYSEALEIQSDSSLEMSLEPVYESLEETGDVRINEVSATTFLFQDEFGENTGFVELYNAGSTDVRLFSFFLSDNLQKLTRYAIPDSILVAAGGFLTLYADGEARQGSLHADFRLDPDGEQVYLSQKVGRDLIILDSARFDFLSANHSFGRYEDGTGNWQHMSVMTPGRPNEPFQLGVREPLPGKVPVFRLYPIPNAGELYVDVENPELYADAYLIDLVDISGKTVYPRIWLNRNRNRLDIRGLERGLYIVRIFRDGTLVQAERLILTK